MKKIASQSRMASNFFNFLSFRRHRLALVLIVALVGFAGPTFAQSTRASSRLLEPPPSYTPVEALGDDASLQAIAMSPDGQLGLAVGEHGVIWLSEDAGETWDRRPSPVQCVLNDVVWISDQEAIAVGGQYDRITQISRGVVLMSNDGGNRWRRSGDEELPLLRSLGRRSEGGAMVAVGDWSAVAESREFESHDRGRTWSSSGQRDRTPTAVNGTPSATRLAWVQATGALTVVRDVAKVRSKQSNDTWFAACDHGMILKGNLTSGDWSVVLGENRQTSILVVAKDPSTMPWSLIGSEALEMQQRVSVVLSSALCGIAGHRQPQAPERDAQQVAVALSAARQAAANLGAASVDVIDIDSLSDQALYAEAKNWIAIHRPAVVVIDHALDKSVSDTFSQIAIAAGVPRVMRYSGSEDGDRSIHSSAMLPAIGAMAGDLYEDAMQLIAPESAAPQMISLRSLYDAAGKSAQRESITSGISIATGQRRSGRLPRATRRQLQVVQARLNEGRRIDRLIESSSDGAAFLKSLEAMLDQTAAEDQLRLAWLICKKLQATELAAAPQLIAFQDALLMHSAERFAGLSFGKWAGLRHEAVGGSLEWQTLRSLAAQSLAIRHSKSRSEQTVQQVAVSPFQIEASGVAQASGSSPIRVADITPTKIQGNVDVQGRNWRRQDQVDLCWEFHPLVLIASEAARRRGDTESLPGSIAKTGNFRRLTDTTTANPWADLVSTAAPNQITASVAATPPKLDGLDNDPFWTTTLTPLPDRPHTEPTVKMSYDEQFIYFFVRCPQSLFVTEPTLASSPRHRDYDLTDTDRLKLSIDVDRDLMTAFDLQTTRSGKTHDAIDGESAWQPTWYVAVNEQAGSCSFEIAVLRRDLVELPISEGDRWFISAQVVPSGTSLAPAPIPDPRLWKPVVFR